MNHKRQNLIDMFYREAVETQKSVIKIGDYESKPLNFFGRLKARRAINYFQKVLEFADADFLLLFFIGKNYQSLREFEKALYYLEKSVEKNTTDALLPHEASIVAMQLGLTDKAINLAKEALKREPENEILLANYAMYLLIAGKFSDAQDIINKAHSISPRNNFIIELKVIIDEVKLGHLTQPTYYSLFNK